MNDGGEVIAVIFKLRQNIKAQLGKDALGFAVGPLQWILLEAYIKENHTYFSGLDVSVPMKDLKIGGLPVFLKGSNGVELIVDPSMVQSMHEYNEKYAASIKLQPAPVIAHVGSKDIIH